MLKTKPGNFFKTFKPFLSKKGHTQNTDVHLNVNGTIIKDQKQISELLVDNFVTIADEIGGGDIKSTSIDNFKQHPSVQQIIEENKNGTHSF